MPLRGFPGRALAGTDGRRAHFAPFLAAIGVHDGEDPMRCGACAARPEWKCGSLKAQKRISDTPPPTDLANGPSGLMRLKADYL